MQKLTCFESFYKDLAKEERETPTDPASKTKTKQIQNYRSWKDEQDEEEMDRNYASQMPKL